MVELTIMTEKIPNQHETRGRMGDAEYRALAERIREKEQGFPYPGLRQESYVKLKAESDEFPEIMTPIDDLVQMLTEQGMQVVVEDNGNVFIVPLYTEPTANNIRDYSVFPKDLEVVPEMDPDLRELILGRR